MKYALLRASAARSAVSSLALTLLLPTLAAVGPSLEELKDAEEGESLVVVGEVKDVSYRPQIRNGVSVYSFQISDGTTEVKVLSQMATMFSPGDKVRVEGVFSPADPGTGQPAQIDATEGVIEVTEASESGLAKMFNRDPRQLMSVPTAPVETTWSMADKLASVLSAIFALVAATALTLRMRRFNVGIAATVLGGDSFAEGLGSLTLVVRIVSTHALSPQLAQTADLILQGRGRFRATSVIVLGKSTLERSAFPLPVTGTVFLKLTFAGVSTKTPLDAGRATLVLRDAVCNKRFCQRFTLPLASLADYRPTEGFSESPTAVTAETELSPATVTRSSAPLKGLEPLSVVKNLSWSDGLILVAVGLLALMLESRERLEKEH